ncbi:cob(I)yrinic acid a,c-diamide adenosyltransferase [Candidatus Heimdallarchaeota archaeon]|nr:MAG: cob(I)yrinic acid a,c-diamide adenosyltransferase [Candidatus Heimdallarchaeota archaeon]
MVKITLITGDGKGKTSTSMGHIYLEKFRNKRIIVAQFLKTGEDCGECDFFKKFHSLRWLTFGKDEFLISESQVEEFKTIILGGIEEITKELNINGTDVLLLDELGVAFSYNLLEWKNLEPLLEMVDEEVILTGRRIPEVLRSKFDEIIEIQEIKHPFNRGIIARKGIDY